MRLERPSTEAVGPRPLQLPLPASSSAGDSTGGRPRSWRSRLIRSTSGGCVANHELVSPVWPSFMIGFVK